MAPRWNEQRTLKFVELYEEHALLWDVYDERYKDKLARQAVLEDIVSKMGIDGFNVDAAKTKIRSLRCTYNLEHQKILRSIANGYGPDEVHKSQLKWLSVMENIMGKNARDPLNTEVEEDNMIEIDATEFDTSSQVEFDTSRQTEFDTQSQAELNSSSGGKSDRESLPGTAYIRCSYSPSIHQSISKKSKTSHPPTPYEKRLDIDKISKAIDELKALNDSLNKTEPLQHECDMFGNHISTQLRQLTPHSCVLAQEEIQKVITKFRIADLNDKTRKSISVCDISTLM